MFDLNWRAERENDDENYARSAFVSIVWASSSCCSGGLVLVRARSGGKGPLLMLTYKMPPNGSEARCAITTDANPRTNHCDYSAGLPLGLLTVNVRFVSKTGERTELGVKTKYEAQGGRSRDTSSDDNLKDVPEQMVWILEPENKLGKGPVLGLGKVELTGEYMDHRPTLLLTNRPDETLDPQESEFRIVSPVLVRGNQVQFNWAGASSIESGNQEAALMMYLPGEGRFLISTVPFENAVEGDVESGQIKFNLEGHDYLLLTAMPTTRSENVWVTHEPRYKPSEHIQGASDNRAMFVVRRLSRLLGDQIQLDGTPPGHTSQAKTTAAAGEVSLCGRRMARTRRPSPSRSLATIKVSGVVRLFTVKAWPYRSFMNYVATGKVYLVYRDYPLSIHSHSNEAAQWANAAALAGIFESVDSALYSTQQAWAGTGKIDEALAGILSPADMNKLRTAKSSQAAEIDAAIARDKALGDTKGVNATPSIFVTHNSLSTELPNNGANYFDTQASILTPC